MKAFRLIAVLCCAALMLVAFSACKDRGTGSSLSSRSSQSSKSSQSSRSSNVISDIISDLESDISDKLDDDSSLLSDDDKDPVSGTAAMGTDFTEIGTLDSTAQGWGPGVRRGADGRPEAAVLYQEKYGKYAADFIRPESGKIYLTFDLGYENGFTPKILDTLKEKGATGVFFITMHYAKTCPELIQRIIDEGHILGNHTCNHPVMTGVSLTTASDEIMGLHNHIKENYDYTMSLFRYPEGNFSEQTLALIQSLGYRSVFWSFAYGDWDPDAQPDPDEAYTKITDFAHDGAIYLLHAVSETNAEILGRVIDNFRDQGYEVAKYLS